MRLSALQDKLSKALSIVGRAVASRSTLPVLGNILLEAKGEYLRLSATNLSIGVNVWIDAKVEDEGAITLPARLLSEFVNSLPVAQRVEIALTSRTSTVNLKCAGYDANIKGIDAAEFPIVPEDIDGGILLPAQAVREMIDRVAFAAATDESRPTLTGVEVVFGGNKMTMAATDGYRLAIQSETIDSDFDGKVIIPATTLTEIARAIGKAEGDLSMQITEQRNQIMFGLDNELGSVVITSSIIDARFPDYRAIIPKGATTSATFKTDEMLKALRVAQLFARDNSNIVRLCLDGDISRNDDGVIRIAGTSSESGDSVGDVAATVIGPQVEIAFNARYLIDALAGMGSDRVKLELTQPNRPGKFTMVGIADSQYMHICMPMNHPK